jgi:hypothetical protein
MVTELRWTVVAFYHPTSQKSVHYRQRLTKEQLLKEIEKAIALGANLLSIRGVHTLVKTQTVFGKMSVEDKISEGVISSGQAIRVYERKPKKEE